MASDSSSRRYLWENRLLFINPVLRRVYAMSTGVIIVLGARQALVKINKPILIYIILVRGSRSRIKLIMLV